MTAASGACAAPVSAVRTRDPGRCYPARRSGRVRGSAAVRSRPRPPLPSPRRPRPRGPNEGKAAVPDLDTIVSLAKRRGFVFPSSEIYGGINAVWDYGPLGVELKNNVKRAWWRAMVQGRDDIVGLDAGILR